MNEGTRVRVIRGPHIHRIATISSASNLPGMSWVHFDGAPTDEQWCIAHDDLALLPTMPALERLIAAAQEAGAEGTWLIRGAAGAMLLWTDRNPNEPEAWPALHLDRPHELIVLMRFAAGDGGEPGVETRH